MRENRQLTKAKNVLDALSRPVTRNNDVFAYNGRSELAEATIAGNHEAHAYDAIGNSTFAAANSITSYYTANNLNQYTSVGRVAPNAPPTSPTYDADGNMTAFGPWTYTYDSNSRLVTVSSNGVLLVTNFYDVKGRRVKKVTQSGTSTYIYDGWNLIYERVDKSNGTTDLFHYVWGKDLSNTLQGAGGVGGLLYVKYNGTIYVPHTDAYGNITRYTDTAGNVVAEYTYDAFGRTISQSGSLSDFFRHRFSSKYFDAETGLYYYGYRFYLPELRRWMTRDPVENSNLYVMACNNPNVYIDPRGDRVVVIKKPAGIEPGRPWQGNEQAMVWFSFPHPYPIEIQCEGGKIRFELTDAPDVLVVNIYFRDANAAMWAMPYEMQHVQTINEYDRALAEFKNTVKRIKDCPSPAWEAYFDAWNILDNAERRCKLDNKIIDRKGGPHDR